MLQKYSPGGGQAQLRPHQGWSQLGAATPGKKSRPPGALSLQRCSERLHSRRYLLQVDPVLQALSPGTPALVCKPTDYDPSTAANIGEDLLQSLSRDDIKDLFPGPENFLRRRALWLVVNKDEKVETAVRAMEPTKLSDAADVPPEEKPTTSKFLIMSSPEYIRHVGKRLMKRLSNVKSPKKASTPLKRRRLTFEKGDSSDFDGDSTTSSKASTILLEKSPTTTSTPEPSHESNEDEAVSSPDLLDSQKSQSRHYKTLQDMYKSKKPNKAAVTHLLNLEFEARRRFITCGVLKESDRPTKVLEAYPCFNELDHTAEDPEGYLQQRPLSCPVLLISKDNCMIAIDKTPVTTFASTKLDEGLVYLMAYYYAFHLTYPKCISTLLSVLQTEILMDSIHDRDTTSTYKKAIAEWRSFTE
uniref:Uncharacterized protein n=1 Tax=Knipowitschia caucasica TaxID=637954 RepID=A0AAV2L2W4_KNICA